MTLQEKCTRYREILSDRTIHIIPYTHGDYAWTHYRQWHVERYCLILGEVLDSMNANPEYTWVTDNALHMIDPFLKAYPERKSELIQYVRDGRLEIAGGAMSLVRPTITGEETYIRNILSGKEFFANLLGQFSSPVYLCLDVAIGHPQLPQILRECGYTAYRGWRPQGAMDAAGIPRQFIWEGLDGSQIVTTRGFYGGFNGISTYMTYAAIENSWDVVFAEFYERELAAIAENSSIPDIWISFGMDDTRPLRDTNDADAAVTAFIDHWNNRESTQLIYSTAASYSEAASRYSLPIIKGTLDAGDVGYNLPTKGNHGLWRARKSMELLLTKAEILSSMAALAGQSYPHGELSTLWRELFDIIGHAQDYTLDADYEHLLAKANASQYRAKELIARATEEIGFLSSRSHKQILLFNTLNWGRTVFADLHISAPEGGHALRLSVEGENLPYQTNGALAGDIRYAGSEFDELFVTVRADLPALGYISVRVDDELPDPQDEDFGIQPADLGFRVQGGLVQTIDTGAMTVSFSKGKIIRIHDSLLGDILDPSSDFHTVSRRSLLEGGGTSSLFYTQYTSCADLIPNSWTWEEYGPLRWVYRVQGNLDGCQVTVRYTFFRDQRIVDIQTELLLSSPGNSLFLATFPTDCHTPIYSDIPFGIEEKTPFTDQYGVVTENIADNIEKLSRGLFYGKSFASYEFCRCKHALISIDCGNYYIADEDLSDLSLALMKSFSVAPEEGWLSRLPSCIDGVGRSSFHYAWTYEPDGSMDDHADLIRLSRELLTPPESAVSIASNRPVPLPESHQFLAVDGGVVITALYRRDERFVLRLADTGHGGICRLGGPAFANAHPVLCTMELKEKEPLLKQGTSYFVKLRPWQIATICF